MLRRSPRKKGAVLRLIRFLMRTGDLTFHSTCDAETRYIRDAFGEDAPLVQITNYMLLPERVEPTPAERPYLLFVGRIDAKKGIDNLLRAVAQATQFREAGWAVRIVGDHDNPYGRQMLALARELGVENSVEFLGHRAGEPTSSFCLQEPSGLSCRRTRRTSAIVVTEALAPGDPRDRIDGDAVEGARGVWGRVVDRQ